MSNVKAFFAKLESKAEAVAQRLFHILKATGGEHGHALVSAIEEDQQASALTPHQLAEGMFQAAVRLAQTETESERISGTVQVLDSMLAELGEAAQKELAARLSCRIQGLNPDAPLHPGAQSTAPTTQPVDGNGAPV